MKKILANVAICMVLGFTGTSALAIATHNCTKNPDGKYSGVCAKKLDGMGYTYFDLSCQGGTIVGGSVNGKGMNCTQKGTGTPNVIRFGCRNMDFSRHYANVEEIKCVFPPN